MLKNKLITGLSAVALMGLAACGGEEEIAEDPALETTEVITTPETETVEVPVVTQDTALVETEVDIDTDVDTIQDPDLGAEGVDTGL